MATYKQASKKSGRADPGVQARTERLSKSLGDSAQQIWLAGIGALGRAQSEGSKLFESLVQEGVNLEQHARRFAGGGADVLREAVEQGVGQARERATGTWERLEKVFEDRVQRALIALEVPARDELASLSRQVETLTDELRRQRGATAVPRSTTKKTAAKKAASKPAVVRKPAVKPGPRPGGRVATPRKSHR